MPMVGIVSKDVITKARIAEQLEAKKIDTVNIAVSGFDPEGFDLIMVDLEAPQGMLILKNYGYKCIAFGPSDECDRLRRDREIRVDRIYKHGEFFKKILPNFKI